MHDGRPSSGSALLAPARMEASFSSIAAEDLHANSTTLGATGVSAERRENNRRGLFGKARNAGNFFRPHIAEIEHHAQHGLGFLDAIGRQLNVVRVRSHRAIEMIGGNSVKGASRGSQSPKAAAGGLGAGKFGNARGLRVKKCNRNGAPAERQPRRELLFEFLPVRHLRSSQKSEQQDITHSCSAKGAALEAA